MRRTILETLAAAALLLLLVLGCRPRIVEAPMELAAPKPPTFEVHFSPKGGCINSLVAHITAAKHVIHVQAYSFTSAPVAAALAAAKKRGVDVRVILDSADFGSVYTKREVLEDAGVYLSSDDKHAIAHNKVMVIDGLLVETGSFNYTAQAENANAENCLFIGDKNLAAVYERNWEAHLTHSVPPPPPIP